MHNSPKSSVSLQRVQLDARDRITAFGSKRFVQKKQKIKAVRKGQEKGAHYHFSGGSNAFGRKSKVSYKAADRA